MVKREYLDDIADVDKLNSALLALLSHLEPTEPVRAIRVKLGVITVQHGSTRPLSSFCEYNPARNHCYRHAEYFKHLGEASIGTAAMHFEYDGAKNYARTAGQLVQHLGKIMSAPREL